MSVNTGDPLRRDIAVHVTNTTNSSPNDSTGTSVDLMTTKETFVVAGHRSNSASGPASANEPLTQLFGAQIGSSQGAAGYQEGVPAGNPSFTFSSANQAKNSSAAAFVVGDPTSQAPLLQASIMLALDPETGFDIEWNSKEGMTYTVLTSDDLAFPTAGWTVVATDLPAVLPRNRFNVAENGTRRFYVIKETPITSENP